MDCILRVIQGPEQGATYRLTSGETIVGRGSKANFKLSPASVSWEHAVFTRDGDDYFVENLSASGTLVNDNKITGRTRLRVRDQIKLSPDITLRFESPDAVAGGLLAQHQGLVTGIVAIALLGLLLVLFNPLKSGPPPEDPARAYATLLPWVHEQADHGNLPPSFPSLFQDGWRLDQARDFKAAKAVWVRAQLELDSVEGKAGFNAASQERPRALYALLHSRGEPTFAPDDYEAALVQWVKWRLQVASRSTKESSW